jgi:two-component system LytT family response regulator
MNCIIVDDDRLSRDAMKHLVSQIKWLNLIGIASNAAEALTLIKNNSIDLLLLDIEMPDTSGIELIKSLKAPPITILATSRKDYALEAFECNVIDYLVKPISFDRFSKAVEKAKLMFENSNQTLYFNNKDYVFIKNSGTIVKLKINDILWIEALGDYITINTSANKYTIHSTMKMLETKLPVDKFIRVHRSFIVSIDSITSIDDNVIVIEKQLIPIGSVYKENLMKRLPFL